MRRLTLLALIVASVDLAAPAWVRSEGTSTPPAADAAPTQLTAAQIARDDALAPRVAAFIDAYRNYAPILLRDGRVVFQSSRDKVPSIYIAPANSPTAEALKLETPDERAFGVVPLPDESGILFISDVNSDGNFRIFRTGFDGHGLRNLTPAETLHRDVPVVARKARGVFAYAAHAASEQAARVFVQDAGGGAPKLIYRDEQGGYVTDFMPDASHLLFERVLSDDDQTLFELDASSGSARQVYPERASARIPVAKYSADGSAWLIVTEALDRPSRLTRVDRATGKERARYEETIVPTGTIEWFDVSPAGDRIAISVDAGNHSEIRLLDARTLALVMTVDAGLGAAQLSRFRADGRSFGVSLTRADGPRDVFAVDTKTGKVSALRQEARPGLDALARPKSSIEVVASFDGTRVPVNVYLPAGFAGKRPTYVSIHGGPSASAYLQWSPTTAFLTSMGFAVLEPNVRGSTGFGVAYQRGDDKEKRGDALKDVEAVNRWARAQPWCDGERIVIGGTSYGGYMTLLALARQPDLWSAGVNASGMSDLRTMERLEDQVVRMYDETEFGILGKEDDLLWEWSPLKYVDHIAAPLFVYQGVHDPISPQNEADQIVRAVRARNMPVEYMLLADEGHGVVRRDNIIRFWARTYRFLEESLKLR